MAKQSSDRLSALGAKYAKMSDGEFDAQLEYGEKHRKQLWADVRSLGASVWSQDETKGKRSLKRVNGG